MAYTCLHSKSREILNKNGAKCILCGFWIHKKCAQETENWDTYKCLSCAEVKESNEFITNTERTYSSSEFDLSDAGY